MFLNNITESLSWWKVFYSSMTNFLSLNNLLRDKCIFKVSVPIMQNISSVGHLATGFFNVQMFKTKPITSDFLNALADLTMIDYGGIDSYLFMG